MCGRACHRVSLSLYERQLALLVCINLYAGDNDVLRDAFVGWHFGISSSLHL